MITKPGPSLWLWNLPEPPLRALVMQLPEVLFPEHNFRTCSFLSNLLIKPLNFWFLIHLHFCIDKHPVASYKDLANVLLQTQIKTTIYVECRYFSTRENRYIFPAVYNRLRDPSLASVRCPRRRRRSRCRVCRTAARARTRRRGRSSAARPCPRQAQRSPARGPLYSVVQFWHRSSVYRSSTSTLSNSTSVASHCGLLSSRSIRWSFSHLKLTSPDTPSGSEAGCRVVVVSLVTSYWRPRVQWNMGWIIRTLVYIFSSDEAD